MRQGDASRQCEAWWRLRAARAGGKTEEAGANGVVAEGKEEQRRLTGRPHASAAAREKAHAGLTRRGWAAGSACARGLKTGRGGHCEQAGLTGRFRELG